MVGRYGAELTNGGPLREDPILLAVLLGTVAVIGRSCRRWEARDGSSPRIDVSRRVRADLPVMARLDLVSAPLRVPLFPGT